ncbi:head maturation protease [Klebsiella phage vB_KpnM_FZ14]|nr:head maturation protease [Klebsiella phage vB_KpnM_FZ14]
MCLTIITMAYSDGLVNMQITVTHNDRKSFALNSQRVYTDEGFLRVPGKAARTGIQEYLASELRLKGRAPNDIIRVYRPAEEVFNDESLQSYLGADVTNNHPPTLVNASTYRNTSVGVVTSVGRQDGDFVIVDMVIKDKDAIKAVETGKCELSAGYTAVYDDTPGTTPEGEPYDFRQTRIKINHVAIVDRARAGAMARIFDNMEKKPMYQITTDTGLKVDVADAAVVDAFKRLEQRVSDAEAAKETVQAQLDAALEQVADLTTKCSDEALKARVEAIARVTSSARKVAGDGFTCDSMDPVAIKRAALAVKRPSVDWAEKSTAYVEAAFDMAVEEPVKPVVDSQLEQLAKDAAKDIKQPVADAKPVLSRAQEALLRQTGKLK